MRAVRHTRDLEQGSASLELLGVSLVLLIPLVYLVMVLAQLQAGAYAASGAARDAGRVFVEGTDVGDARGRADAAAAVIFADYGIRGGHVATECLDDPCLGPDARVRTVATVDVPLPWVPDLARSVVPTTVTVRGEHLSTVDRFRSVP